MAAAWLTETDLPPDVFAVVMATGIVSIAGTDHHYPRISQPLAVIGVVAFVLLLVGLAVRVIARPRSALGEVGDPDVALGLFTFVAACAVLGARLDDHPNVVWALGAAALAAWLVLVPLAVRDVRSRPRAELRDHAHGAWLLPSVGTAGLAVTASDLAVHSDSAALLLVASVAWLLGLLLYVAVTWLIAWRAVAAPFVPDEVTPDSWILMGGLAIATLAGAHLLAAADALGLPGYGTWVRPITLVAWILAGLWIPVLLYAEVWRIDQRAGSLHYTRVWWAAVFPLGMYSSATQATGVELRMRSLTTMSLVFFWIALTVWLLVTVGLAHVGLARVGLVRRRAPMR
ncbi:MAG: tellurite resistance/C4-dicarboxylate transporter family protein [Jatrophihabitantaceae bacterium]